MEAGSRRLYDTTFTISAGSPADYYLVCALFGVVLIARPAFLFGHVSELADVPLSDGTGSAIEDVVPVRHVTPTQRLTAVGYVPDRSKVLAILFILVLSRVALLGVLGATGACKSNITNAMGRTNYAAQTPPSARLANVHIHFITS